jgi:hypothetical protein
MACQSCQIVLNRTAARLRAGKVMPGVAAVQLEKIRAECPDAVSTNGSCRLVKPIEVWAGYSEADATMFRSLVGA